MEERPHTLSNHTPKRYANDMNLALLRPSHEIQQRYDILRHPTRPTKCVGPRALFEEVHVRVWPTGCPTVAHSSVIEHHG